MSRAVTIRRTVVEHEVDAVASTWGGQAVIEGPTETSVRVEVHGLTAMQAARLRDDVRALVEDHVEAARGATA